MIDLILLREKPELVKDLLKRKDPTFDTDRLINLDQSLRKIKTDIEELRHEKNILAESAKNGLSESVKEKSKSISQILKSKEPELKSLEHDFENLYLRCPNLIEEDVPTGDKEDNLLTSEFSQKPVFDFEIKNHVELGKINSWFDFEAACKMTGSNFALYQNRAVNLVYSLMLYMLNNNIKHGYNPVLPPYLVNEKALISASNLPRFKDEVYSIPEDNLYLTPTSEVNLTNIYRDQILQDENLPIRMTAWTSCFRREAGGYGAAERGLIRIHQFEKCELYTICTPENAKYEQEKMINCAEQILKDLNLHYRIMLLASQDTSFASAKTYDIEVWLPAQKIYKEVSSISNCTDFQARRSKMRYYADNKTKLVNTLNGSSLALPRLLVAIMETYQNPDGTITIPDILKNLSFFKV